jgi:voltage-gated potassium channel
LVRRLSRGQVTFLLLLAATSIVLGAWLFSDTQRVSFGTSLYWAFTTASTVRYGEGTPHNGVGRAIAVGEMVTAIPLFAGLFLLSLHGLDELGCESEGL